MLFDKAQETIAKNLDKANALPMLPGVYIMHGKGDEIIYVGKAKKLKNRVTQYFRKGTAHTPKVAKMVSSVEWFEYIVCDSEFEALILECSLIKQHSPKYNILLKDDKGYHYVKIVRTNRPSIEYVKFKEEDGAEYLGPYNSGWVVRQTVEQARKIFKLADCSRRFDVKSRECLNFHIGLCSAPCAGKISADSYRESFNSAVEFIKKGGCSSDEIADLKQKMKTAADNLEFELAARLRDRISAIEKIYEKQKVIKSEELRQDVFAFVEADSAVAAEVFNFHRGHLSDRHQHIIESVGSKEELRAEFIKGYYTDNTDIPPVILVDGEVDDKELIERWLSEKLGKSVNISVPIKGEKRKTVEMCSSNAAEFLAQSIKRSGKETAALDELASLLGLAKTPTRIEAYDISNTAGSYNVAGMTVFVSGRPDKKSYRRFKIKGFSGQDDYRSMEEVLTRRFTEYNNGTAGFEILPDLILLDGGKGQISAVKPVLEKLGIDVPLFGMVKDSKHRTRAVASSGGDIAIKANRKAYTLITTIQDETHRYAITYHRASAKRGAFKSSLTEIEGVGKKRAEALLKSFGSLSNLKTATVEQIAGVKGVTQKAAEAVYNHFHNS